MNSPMNKTNHNLPENRLCYYLRKNNQVINNEEYWSKHKQNQGKQSPDIAC
jgi:hypothetical protein